MAVAGAVLVGTVGAAAFAGPASAHTASLTYQLECGKEKGTAIVTWTVTNNFDKKATVKNLARDLDGLAGEVEVKGKESVSGTEVVDVSKESVEFSATVDWRNKSETVTEKADLTKLDCDQDDGKKVEVTFTDNCDGTVVVKMANNSDKVVKFRVNGHGTWKEAFEVEPGKTAEVTVPKEHASEVAVRLNNDNGRPFLKHEWTKPEGCGITVTHKSDCDNLLITVENAADNKTIVATVKFGDQSADQEIKPGEAYTATIPGAANLVVTLVIGKTSTDFKYEKPANCSPGLPVTGVNAGLLAGAALALVSGGAGLFFVARRRRIRFAA
jgi:hypothetical protein